MFRFPRSYLLIRVFTKRKLHDMLGKRFMKISKNLWIGYMLKVAFFLAKDR